MSAIVEPLDEQPMAKKKAAPKRPGRPLSAEGAKKGRVVMRASEEWVEWLDRVRRARGWERSRLLRETCKAFSRQEGIEMPPNE